MCCLVHIFFSSLVIWVLRVIGNERGREGGKGGWVEKGVSDRGNEGTRKREREEVERFKVNKREKGREEGREREKESCRDEEKKNDR